MVEISASILDVKEEESAKTFYNLEVAKVNFEKIKCPVSVLTNYDELLEVAVSFNYIDHVAKEKLLKWKLNPHDESWMKD